MREIYFGAVLFKLASSEGNFYFKNFSLVRFILNIRNYEKKRLLSIS